MFVADRIVYLQMPKAGSTHVTNILQRFHGGCAPPGHKKHSQLKDYDRYRSRLIVSSVRNPWDWYVSLWAFGCSGHGGLWHYFNNLPRSELREAMRYRDFRSVLRFPLRSIHGRPNWRRLYSCPDNEAHFREWLKLLLGPEGLHVGLEGYASSTVNTTVGFMTYRFLALTTHYSEWMRTGRKCRTYDKLTTFADEHNIVDRVLRLETLNDELVDLLVTTGVDVSAAQAAQWSKSNTSTRRASFEYYDEETSRLIESRDRFIVERFGYQRPSI